MFERKKRGARRMIPRKPLTRSQLAELVLAQMGKCKACGNRLDFAKKGQVIDEHLTPLAEGGTNETDNRALYCKPCATAKTGKEVPARAKSKRIAEGRTQADRRQRAKAEGKHKAIPSRPLPKGRKFETRKAT
jgi:5-methylcytosine-specific restriction endonuclease McrA